MHAEKYSYLNILLLIGEYITLVTIYQLDLPPCTHKFKLATPYLTINSNSTSLIVPRLWNLCMQLT